MNNKNKILSTVGIYHGFNDGAVVIIPILFPVFKVLFNLSYTQIGIITGGGLLITLITQIFIGLLSDKKNRRMILSLGVLFLSASLLLLTQIQGFLTLLVFIFLLRFSAGFFHPVGIGWISKIFKKEKLDWAMGMQSALGDFGAFIGILTTAFIVDFRDWSYPFYVWAIIGIFCLFTGLLLTRGIKEDITNNEKNKKKKITFKEKLVEEKEILKAVKFFIPGLIISGSAWGIVVSYLPLLLDEKTVLSLSMIGVVVSIWIGVGTIVCLFYGKIISFFGRKKVIIFSYIGMGLMGFALSIFTEVFILIIIMIILGISTFLTYPAIFSYVSEKTDEAYEGKVFGYLFTVQLGGGTFLLFISGVTSDIWGIWTPFFILGVLSILISILLIGNQKKLMPVKTLD
ncbi:MAG: MFS transporter [Thermoplasmatales archaeon]|nr:MFS transporter [Thermoplasmatales archaeon]